MADPISTEDRHWRQFLALEAAGQGNGAITDIARISPAAGLAQWLPEAIRLANQVKAAEIWPEAVLWFSLDVV